MECFYDHHNDYRSLMKFEGDWIGYKKVMPKTKFMADLTPFPLYFGHNFPPTWGTPK